MYGEVDIAISKFIKALLTGGAVGPVCGLSGGARTAFETEISTLRNNGFLLKGESYYTDKTSKSGAWNNSFQVGYSGLSWIYSLIGIKQILMTETYSFTLTQLNLAHYFPHFSIGSDETLYESSMNQLSFSYLGSSYYGTVTGFTSSIIIEGKHESIAQSAIRSHSHAVLIAPENSFNGNSLGKALIQHLYGFVTDCSIFFSGKVQWPDISKETSYPSYPEFPTPGHVTVAEDIFPSKLSTVGISISNESSQDTFKTEIPQAEPGIKGSETQENETNGTDPIISLDE